MPRYLVTVSLGPVQGLIGAARRTRDLWCGSWLLSEAARAAARALHRAHPGCLIFPAPVDPERDLEPLDAPGDEANIANVLRAEVAFAGATAGVAADKARLRALCAEARDAAVQRLVELGVTARAKVRNAGPLRDDVWQAQIRDVLEVFAAWVPGDTGAAKDYAQMNQRLGAVFAARKATRDFGPSRLEEKGAGLPKCSLDGGFETVLPEPPAPALVRRLALSRGEQLDALGVIKRLAGDPEQFTAYARIAADPWLRQLTGDQLQRLRATYEPLVAAGLATRVRGNAGCYGDFPFDAQLLYGFRLRNALAQEAQEPAEREALLLLRRELAAIGRAVGRAGRRCGEPVPYAAILQADGDRMGKLLARAQSPEQSRQVSRALHGFASEVRGLVREHHGHAIYSGGDDVLALVPLESAVACAQMLADRFSAALGPVAEALGLPAGERPTLSVGLGVGHLMEPLGSLRARALRAEQLAKGDALGAEDQRNALGIVLGIRSGGEIEWRARWNDSAALRELQDFTADYRAARLPSRVAYDLRAIDRRLCWLPLAASDASPEDRAMARGMRAAEVQRMLDRARRAGGAEKISPELQDRIALRAGVVPLAQLADTLIVARWLAARTRADVETR
ncbi:CRISPR-associated RAMP Cmr2 [Thioalkalivibrio nitratireducens DSM 14787]|uniref:CRISPR-associated RAMP Cmr2 n=1 Tax=Thioalkalivibrio nitratireducens (strain DSM 14787 / UNIQEM 213 / ALEN2) TaxID=1255043 RepID=L0DU66_THIND|nr:type III-B CRISPR-associated protein Cas10/Cmr2 [Thioalkalivibrio nitratireducens]AGA33144.1 CRISPR-associated RAMP Cmr2 [Thioalkalivibrio nitratireducens DSM 14787]